MSPRQAESFGTKARPRVIRAADEPDVLHDQLDALLEHAAAGEGCGCRSAEMHAHTCDRHTWIRALLLEPFSDPAEEPNEP